MRINKICFSILLFSILFSLLSNAQIKNQNGAYARLTPQSQIKPLDQISIDFFNPDSTQSVKTTLTVEITDPTGFVTVFSERVEVESLKDSTVIFPTYIPSVMGKYSMVFKSTFNSDELIAGFEIGDYTFAHDSGAPYEATTLTDSIFAENNFIFDVGSIFIAGKDDFATHIGFGLQNARELFTGNPTADVFTVALYGLDEPPKGDEDTYDNFSLLEFGGYTLDGFESPEHLICVEFFSPVFIQEGRSYLAMIQYNGENAGTSIAPQYLTSGNFESSYFNTVVFTDRLYMGGFEDGKSAVARLLLAGVIDNTENISLAPSKIQLYPTVTAGKLFTNIDLENKADNIRIQIANISGKVIKTFLFENIHQQVLELELDGLKTGNYFLNIQTPEGNRSLKFFIKK